jgi:hypothetical protein
MLSYVAEANVVLPKKSGSIDRNISGNNFIMITVRKILIHQDHGIYPTCLSGNTFVPYIVTGDTGVGTRF